MAKKSMPAKYLPWIEARKRFHLSDAHIQMAREMGLNPKKFGSLDNHKQEPWKAPLPEFIEDLLDSLLLLTLERICDLLDSSPNARVASLANRAASGPGTRTAPGYSSSTPNEEYDDNDLLSLL